MIPRSSAEFDIAIICALPLEFDAVEALFDEHYDAAAYEKQHGDANFYRTGKIHQHNVVLTCLPEMGKRSAASVASSLQCTFTTIYLTLLVGICGGVPYPLAKTGETELILGDVIISSSIVEFDFGKQHPDKFQPRDGVTDTIGRDRRIRTLLAALRTSRLRYGFQQKLSKYLAKIQDSDRRWGYPGAEHDRLYEASYRHKHYNAGPESKCFCGACDSSKDPVCDEALESDCSKLGCNGVLVNRNRISSCDLSPQIHIGTLGSGDTVMKSGEHRDELAKTAKIMGFEMEGAGVCDSLRCLIIKGICDYADSHKNKMWQQYAAATAASCCKAFLEILPTITQKSVTLFDEDRGTTFEVGTNGSSSDRTSNRTYSANTLERLGLTSLDGSPDGHDDYRWDFTSTASDIDDMEHHLNALKEELHRIKGNIVNPLVKSVLVSGFTQAVEKNPQMLRSSQGIESFRASFYDTKFGKIIIKTQVDRKTIRSSEKGENCTHYKTTTSFIFHPASWLIKIGFKYGLEAMITNSRAGWQYSILPVRSVADDALIFDLCKHGNVDAVRELFGRGDASVLDINSEGWRPLHFATCWGHLDLAEFLIMQGADKAASTYHMNHTPASLILSKGEAIRLLRLFDDCIDLSEADSQGWNIFDLVTEDRADSEYQIITRVISFFHQKYRMSIIDGYYEPPIRYVTMTSIYGSIAESIQILLDFDPQTRPIDNIISRNGISMKDILERPLAFDVIQAPHTSTDILRTLLDKGADVHAVNYGETPTSLSLYFSYAFLRWRDRLQDIYQELDDFIASETLTNCILERSGWHAGTLRTLFSLRPCETLHYTIGSCDLDIFDESMNCEKHETDDWEQFIEPWWEELKYNIKSSQCLCFLLKEGGMYLDRGYLQEATPKFEAHGISAENTQTVPAVQSCKRNGYPFSILEEIYHREGTWQFHYEPGEIWCGECLAEREGFYESSSEGTDTEDSDEGTDVEILS